MSAPTPASIAERVYQQINHRVGEAVAYVESSDFQMLRWDEEISKLNRVRPDEAHICWAMLASLQGDIARAEGHIAEAERTGAVASNVVATKLTVYANLLLASKVLGVLRSEACMQHGVAVHALKHAILVGAFGWVGQAALALKTGGVAVHEPERMEVAADAHQLLQEQGVTDDDCAAVIDVAGTVMREQGLFWGEKYSDYVVNHELGTVGFEFEVATTAQEAASMTSRVVDLLIDAGLTRLPITVSFLGSKD